MAPEMAATPAAIAQAKPPMATASRAAAEIRTGTHLRAAWARVSMVARSSQAFRMGTCLLAALSQAYVALRRSQALVRMTQQQACRSQRGTAS